MPSIPITNTLPYIQYIANQGQTVFTVPYVFFWDTVSYPNPLLVFYTPSGSIPNDVTDLITQPSQYTITQNINYTGSVTFVTPCNAGDIVTIVRDMNNVRLNYYISGGAFTSDAVNTDFESEVLYIQQNTFSVGYTTPHYNYSATPAIPGDVVLPVLTANQIWVKDPTDTFIEAVDFVQPPPPGLFDWELVTESLQMVEGFGYVVQGTGIVLTMPTTLTFGDEFAIMLTAGSSASIQLQSNQTMQIYNQTTGTGSTVSFGMAGDTVILVATSSSRVQVLSGGTRDYSWT
jgi:hypothetical protein